MGEACQLDAAVAWPPRRIDEVNAKDRDNLMQSAPTITVVICTRDRPASLLETLRSLRTQTHRPDELLILDDSCLSPPDRALIALAAREVTPDWRIISTGGRGLTASRNLAANSAKGDILLFLDDDVTCEANVVGEIVRLMSDPLVAGVTATIIEPAFRTQSGRIFQAAYRIAGWWDIAPRGTPACAKPMVLSNPRIVRRAKWLSGAAMALRRSVVLAHPFDETLTEYALGEDREMGYRLIPHYWLLESRVARVVHRRDGGGRADPYRMGFMTARNYASILRKTCDLNAIHVFLMAWSFIVLSLMHAGCALMGRRSHWHELRGLVAGVWSVVLDWTQSESRLLKRSETVGSQSCKGPTQNANAHAGSRWPTSSQWHPQLHANDRSRAVLSPVGGDGFECARTLLPNRREDTPALINRPEDRPVLFDRRQDTAVPIDGRPLRALFVTNRLTHGGAERMLLTLVKRLPPLGITPTVACLQDAGPLAGECESAGIVVHDGLLRHKTDVAVILRLRQIIEAAAIDVVVVAHSGGDRMFWPTIAAAASELPVVVWSHWFPRAGVAHIERPNRALYRLIDAFVALGEAHRNALIRHEHVPAGRIAVIPNGIDLAPFESLSPREQVRSMIGLGANDTAVGLMANLRPEKRHDVFIEAAARVASVHSLVRFFIIGDGPDRERVASLVQAVRLTQPTLRMLGARNDTPDLLRALDIACLCSDIECQPVVMLEAAAAGCAFIGPNVGCLPEFITHRESGLLVQPSDPAGLADAISELSMAPALRHRLALAAATRVRERCDASRMAQAFAAVFRKCVTDRRRRGLRQEITPRPIVAKLP